MDWRDLWRRLFPERMIDSDLHEELSFHIDERVRELVRQGWDEERARTFVRERFGDMASVEEACRGYDAQRVRADSWRLAVEGWGRDLRLALRGLRASGGFTAAVTVTLALAIGASTAVFSVVEAVLLRPLPYPAGDRLAVVWQNDRATGTVRESASASDYYDYLERSRTFADLAMYGVGAAVLRREDGASVHLEALSTTANLVEVLGVRLQRGRFFRAEEDRPGGPRVAVLTDHLWRDLFGAAEAAVGRTIVIDERAHEVVGVLPPDVAEPLGRADIWLPIQQSRAIASRESHWVRVVGRLTDGSSVAAAQAEMTEIMADLEIEYPDANTNRGAFVEPLEEVDRGDLRTTLWVLFGAVLAVLGIACVNAANLLLARGSARMRELAVLQAVGAGERQIARRFFVEALLLAALAASGGIALAAVGLPAVTSLAPGDVTVLGDAGLNARVLAFAVAVTALVCLAFGLLPALQARGIDLTVELKEGRSAAARASGLLLRRGLVAAQLSLAVILLFAAILLASTVRNLQSVRPGFVAESVLRVDFAIPESRFPSFATYPDWPEIQELIRSLEEEADALPGVRSAAVTLNHPLDPGFTNSFGIEGRPYDADQGEMTTRLVTPGYFETAGLEVVSGRALEPRDRVETPNVIVLNRAAADRYFAGGEALGSRITFWGQEAREVVGIAENERMHGLAADPPPAMYVSMYQAPPRGGRLTLMLRTDVPPLSLVESVREAVRRVDAAVPIFNPATLEETLAAAIARERFASALLTAFSVVAVLLAVLGVHGVLAYLVSQRRREVGVRMALGASRRRVVWMVLGQGVAMTVLGIGAGIAGALAVSGVLQRILFGVSATAPWSYVVVALGMTLVALAATALPAHRAASINPASSLRAE